MSKTQEKELLPQTKTEFSELHTTLLKEYHAKYDNLLADSPAFLTIDDLNSNQLLKHGVNLFLRNSISPIRTAAQNDLVELAITLNANVKGLTFIPYSLELKIIEQLLQHGLNPDKLLDSALDSSYGISANVEEKQIKLIDLAFAHKASANSINYFYVLPSANLLQRLIDNGLDINKALHFVTNISTNKYDILTSSFIHDHAKREAQLQLVQSLFARGADINSLFAQKYFYISDYTQEFILINKDNLLSRSLNPLSANNFLKVILYSNTALSDKSGIYVGDPEKIELQGKLIQEALARGANIYKVLDSVQLSISLLDNHKELIVKHFGADRFLLWTLEVLANLILDRNVNIESHTKTALELVKHAIANGADVNANNDHAAALNIANDQEIVALLQNHGAKCSSKQLPEIYAGGLEKALFNPAMIIEQKYKNLDAPRTEQAKMPYILHHIWLTHPDSPKEIREQDLKIALDTKDTFAKAPAPWEHIVWTNDKNLIPNSVNSLADHNIEVRSIYDYQEVLSLFGIIEQLISQKKWGMASDTLRYSLVEHFGGVYADINFIFHRDMTDEAHKYNFFTQTNESLYIDNFFFGASAHHPIIEKTLALVERNLVNPPEYLASIKNPDSSALTDMSTANPTYLAYYTTANKEDYIDVVYPQTNYMLELDNQDANAAFTESREYNFFDDKLEYLARFCDRCPDHKGLIDTLLYVSEHEICGSDRFSVGHDSTDGQTWLN